MKPAKVIEDKPSDALVVREPQAQVSLFRTDDPIEVVARATKVADALRSVIEKQELVVEIQGKKHPKCEAWTLCGTMLGVFPVLCWTRVIENGWEARVEARLKDGAVVGAAESECLRTERLWKDREDFAVRSMAQTRATAKALRMPLGFIMTLAGYEATPSDEMTFDRNGALTSKRTPANSGTGAISSPASEKPLPIANAPKHATAKTREWMIEQLNAHMGGEGRMIVDDYFKKLGWLMPNEALEELPLRFVPINQKQLKALQSALNSFVDGLEAEKPYEQNPEPTIDEKAAGELLESEDWKSFPVPFGKDAGKTLGSLDGKKVFGWAMNFKVETEYKGKPRPENKITLDKAFRKALDAAALHYGWDLTKV